MMEHGDRTQPEKTLTCKTTCNTGLTWEDSDDRIWFGKLEDVDAG